MARFIIRRLLQMVVVVFVLSLMLFFWLRSLPGGTVSAILGERATPQTRAALTKALGLDQPVWVQYWRFVERAAHGEFGTSTRVLPGADALDIFLSRLPATIELSFFALLLAVVLAIPLGYLSARRAGSPLDSGLVVTSLVGVAVPVFFLAFLLKYQLAVEHHVFPVSGRQDNLSCTRVTNFFVLDGLLTREYDCSVSALKHLVLPSLALATIPFAVIYRITRASVLEVLGEDYVRTAESKGLTARVIRGRHVLRNALLPVVTTIGLQTGGLLAGAVLTEKVFNWGGIGNALADAFEGRDYAVLQVLILAAAMIYVVINLLVDISYAVIDPRVRTR
ncbi:ABC transporter permease [Phycicoccus endophyticus]|uniref:ABC transporter permease n=1 Tax=Phycicoccus endophyticus TaxID=1690220 RepID=UPI001408FA36|nr:ABC transporter permease [Phycicoccus endophyticus]NHI18926.1 ABC transporter permease [Phycicoccus endophyticus]GGL31420.1 peptide ABC transporter permease [Phycicoccus endophyticus]